MAVTIRLMRFGKKGSPYYRVVALDKRKKRDGAYIEKIGLYDPSKKPEALTVDQAKLDAWLAKGAQVSEGMRKLLKNRKSK